MEKKGDNMKRLKNIFLRALFFLLPALCALDGGTGG